MFELSGRKGNRRGDRSLLEGEKDVVRAGDPKHVEAAQGIKGDKAVWNGRGRACDSGRAFGHGGG